MNSLLSVTFVLDFNVELRPLFFSYACFSPTSPATQKPPTNPTNPYHICCARSVHLDGPRIEAGFRQLFHRALPRSAARDRWDSNVERG